MGMVLSKKVYATEINIWFLKAKEKSYLIRGYRSWAYKGLKAIFWKERKGANLKKTFNIEGKLDQHQKERKVDKTCLTN